MQVKNLPIDEDFVPFFLSKMRFISNLTVLYAYFWRYFLAPSVKLHVLVHNFTQQDRKAQIRVK